MATARTGKLMRRSRSGRDKHAHARSPGASTAGLSLAGDKPCPAMAEAVLACADPVATVYTATAARAIVGIAWRAAPAPTPVPASAGAAT